MGSQPIVFICHPYHRGGVTRWMADMAIECADQKLDVYFITIQPRRTFFSAGGRETLVSLLRDAKGVKLITASAGWEFEFGTEAYKTSVYASLLRKHVPKGASVILADDRSVWGVSAQLHTMYNFVGVLHADEDHYYDLALQYQNTLSLFVCVSKRITQKLVDRDSAIDRRKIFTIPCGIPLPEFIALSKQNERLEIIYAGRITQYQKRVFDIPPICVALKSAGVSFRLTVIGSGGDLQQLKTDVAVLGLEAEVRFLGWLQKEQIFENMQHSDVLLMTSDFEGMPVAVMEALSCGCAVVSTRVSGVEDFAGNPAAFNCIYLYDTGDITQAADHFLRLKNLINTEISNQARQLAEAEFSISLCLERYLHAFQQLQSVGTDKTLAPQSYGYFAYSYFVSFSRYVRVSLTQKNI